MKCDGETGDMSYDNVMSMIACDRSPVTTVVQSFRSLMMNDEHDQQNSASYARLHGPPTQLTDVSSPVSSSTVVR